MKLFHAAMFAVGGALLAVGVGGVSAEDQVQVKEATCPVSGHKVAITDKTATLTVNGEKEYFCCADCPTTFAKEPAKYMKTALTCPVMKGNKVTAATQRVAINDNLLLTCCGGCPAAIEKNPAKYVTELRDPVNSTSFKLTENAPHSQYKGVHYFFASADNKKTFDAAPDKYSNKWLSKAS